ncbi:MAG: RNA polymerase Rpb4 family protein [Candidatus Micrarchaeaceae archaeon]
MLGDVSDKKPVTVAEAHEILEKRGKAGALGYEQNLALEHAAKFKKLSASKAVEMKKELMGIGISEKVATKIVDIMPAKIEILKQVLILERRPVDEGQVSEAMQIIAKYKGK